MITITYTQDKHRVEVQGHAGYDEPGKDIVCASVSALVYTLAANLIDAEDRHMVRELLTDIRTGNTVIQCIPSARSAGEITRIYHTVLRGMELIAKNYPDYVACVKK